MRNDDDLNNNLGRSQYVNPYSSGGEQYRDMTTKEKFLGFFDPQNRMGRVTEKKASQIEANTLNFIGGIQDDAKDVFDGLINTDYDSLPNKAAFRDAEAFELFKDKLRDKRSSQFGTMDVQIIYNAIGDEDAILTAARMQDRLGNSYKLAGEGKRIDLFSSEYGYNEYGFFTVINPAIRSMKRGKEGDFFYSADITSDGRPIADMSEAELLADREKLNSIITNSKGERIPISSFLNKGFTIAYDDFLSTRPGYEAAERIVKNNERAIRGDQRRADDIKTVLDENAKREDTLISLKNIIEEDEQAQTDGFRAGPGIEGSEITGYDYKYFYSPSAGGPVPIGQFTEQIKNLSGEDLKNAIKNINEENSRQTNIMSGTIAQARRESAGGRSGDMSLLDGLLVYPEGSVYGMDAEQFGEFSLAEQEKLARDSKALSDANTQTLAKSARIFVKNQIRAQKDLTPADDGVATADRTDNIQTVRDFYDPEKEGISHADLIKRLAYDPEKLAEYRKDPYQFALNNSLDDIKGPPIETVDLNRIKEKIGPEALKLVPELNKLLDDPTTTRAELTEFMNKAISTVKDSSTEAQQELLSIPAVASGNLGAADQRLRTGFMFLIGAIEPEGTDIRKAIINPENMRNFAATGTFQRPTTAPAPSTAIADQVIQDITAATETISDVALSELSGTQQNNAFNDANRILSEGLTLIRGAPPSQETLIATEKLQTLSSRIINERVKALSGQGALREFIELFTTNYPPVDEMGFAQRALRLKYDKEAGMFSFQKPGGGTSTFTLKSKDVLNDGERGGVPLLQALIKMAEVNEQLEQFRQKVQ